MTEVPILDYQQGLYAFGGDEEMFLSMINLYDEEHFNQQVLRLHKGLMKMDFDEIRIGGYMMKGPAAYIGAQRLYNIAAELQRKGAAKEPMNSILKDYFKFLNVARELKKEIAKILKRPVSLDVADFDIFETQVRATFPDYSKTIKENNSAQNMNPVCQGCNIF